MTKYTKEQIEKIISEHKFEYQKIVIILNYINH